LGITPPFANCGGVYAHKWFMEITTLSFLFWFSIVLLILSSLKSARRAALINIFCALGFILLGICHIFDILYVAPFSAGDYSYDPTQPLIPMQGVVGWFYMLFGLGVLINTVFALAFGSDDEERGVFIKGGSSMEG
jgi:hypothetical protein